MTAAMVTATTRPIAPVSPLHGALQPLGTDQVRLDGGFWGDRQALNAAAIIPHIAHWEERVGWIGNFDAVVDGTIAERRHGREFADSEVYKLLEAMAWEIGRTGDAALEEQYAAIVQRVVAAQRPDGYLNTNFGSAGQASRYSDLEWGHELYCYGHLIQAAVARLRTGHHDALVDAALRAADHVCAEFGTDGRQAVCGHAEIEPALVELSRATGEQRYLSQAQLFLDRRGHGTLADMEFGRAYYQDDLPIRDAQVLRGHAVRALYLSAGAVDAGTDAGDAALVEAVQRQFRRTLERRTYITGGMGSHHQDEAFGDDFELPPDRAYCETCAGIGSVMVAWRLLLATGDLSYGDVIERALFNVVAASPSAAGTAFFYTNPLQQRVAASEPPADEASPRAHAQLRAPWFAVSCCPTNVARTFAQLAAYVATTDEHGVQLVTYAPGSVRAEIPGRGPVALTIVTRYPDAGTVAIRVDAAPAEWTLTLRIPGWAQGETVIERAGAEERASAPVARVENAVVGETILLRLPVRPRITRPDERIDAVRGTVAVERGPLVLCAESIDLPGGADVAGIRIDPDAPVADGDDGAVAVGDLAVLDQEGWPYTAESGGARRTATSIPLVPYHSWANRGPGTMRVWLPVAD